MSDDKPVGKDTGFYMPQELADSILHVLKEEDFHRAPKASNDYAAFRAWLEKHWAVNINACPACKGWAVKAGG